MKNFEWAIAQKVRTFMRKEKGNNTLASRLIAGAVALVVTILLGLAINYLALPAISFASSGFWWFCIVMGVIATVAFLIANVIVNEREGTYGEGHIPTIVIISATGVLLLVFIVTAIIGGTMVQPKEHSNLITIENGNFDEDISKINLEELVVVDVRTACQTGQRVAAKIPNSYWYEIDSEYNLVVINGTKYRISPINYGGLFKYFKADDTGIPGYILVDAKDPKKEAQFVELEENMKYSPSACFGYDLDRHLRGQYPSYIFGKHFFEVDDEGTPFWITAVKTPQIGMRGGLMTTSVLVTNAVTGHTDEYAMDKIPSWIDHVNSVSYLMNLVDWHYSLWDGWWNAVTSKTGVYKTSYYYKDQEQSASSDDSKSDKEANKHTPFEGYNSIVTEDNKVMFYTGLTPANNAETNIGFLLIDPVNHKFTYYEATGAEEASAQMAAEGLVSDLRYSASFPTVVNVDGIETYFMVLKDAGGLIKRYAFCNVANYARCVQAENLEDALKLYKETMCVETENEEVEESKETKYQYGVIAEVEEAQIEGYTYYYFTFEGKENEIFISSIENSSMQPMKLKAGAKVNVEFYESESEEGINIVIDISFKEHLS